MADLEFTRGDTKNISFSIKDVNGNPMELTMEDRLYFTVKRDDNSTKVLLQKVFPDTITYNSETKEYEFTITSDDTSSLAYGTYQYDIELKSNDYVKTLSFGTITLTSEITFKGDEV